MSKTPVNSGIAGQIISRTVVSLVGKVGVDEDDPLAVLNRFESLLVK